MSHLSLSCLLSLFKCRSFNVCSFCFPTLTGVFPVCAAFLECTFYKNPAERMRETMPNRMLIIENLPRSSSTEFSKVPFVRKPTLIRDPKVHVQRSRNSPKLPQPNQPTLIELPAQNAKRRPLKISARVASDDSRFLSGDNRPLRSVPLERSYSQTNGLSVGSQMSNVRKLQRGLQKNYEFNCGWLLFG